MNARRIGLAWYVVALFAQYGVAFAAEEDRWIEIRSTGFTVLSQFSERRSRSLVRELQTFQAALPYFTTIEDTRPRVPARIFLLREKAFRQVTAGIEDVGGVLFAQPFHNDIVVNASLPNYTSLALVFHEYVHHALRNSSHMSLPPFYEEALAQLAQSFQVEGRQAHFGIVSAEVARVARKPGHMSLSDLIAVDRGSEEYRRHGISPSFYARSLIFLHYCQLGRPERATQLRSFVDRLVAGAEPLEAFSAAFDTTPQALDGELDGYLRSHPKLHGILNVSTLPEPEKLTVRTVAPHEALTQFALLRLRVNKDPAGIEELLQPALALQPESLPAVGGMAVLTHRGTDASAANQWLTRLTTAAVNDAMWLTRAGFLILENSRRTRTTGSELLAPETQKQMRNARALFERALELEPERLESAFGYGLTHAFVPDDPEKGKRIVAAALERLPGSGELKWVLARLQAMTGQKDSALVQLRDVACAALDSDIRTLARKEIGEVRCSRIPDPSATSVSLRPNSFVVALTPPRMMIATCETPDAGTKRAARQEIRRRQYPSSRSYAEYWEAGDTCGR